MGKLLAFSLKNILSKKLRTFLSVVGVSIAVATIYVFSSTTYNLKDSVMEFGRQTGADIIITQNFIVDLGFGSFPKALREELSRHRAVRAVDGSIFSLVLLQSKSQKLKPSLIIGRELNGELLSNMRNLLIEGSLPQNDSEAIVGEIMADEFKIRVGDHIGISGHLGKSVFVALTSAAVPRAFKVTGIYRTKIAWEDGACIVDAGIIRDQRNMAEGSFNVGFIFLKPEFKRDVPKVIEELQALYPDYSIITIDRITDALKYQFEIIDRISIVVTAMAIILGSIGVLNTLLMNMTERKKEIATLLAIGWSKLMVVRTYLYEGMAISILGSVFGVALGYLILDLLISILSAGINNTVPLPTVIECMAVGVIIGGIGGIYPAYKASKVNPAACLRND